MLTLAEVMQFKIKGIMNLDNCIVVDNYTEEEITDFATKLIKSTNLPVEIIYYEEYDFENNSVETTALKNLLQLQMIYDKVLSSDNIIIISNLKNYYKNKTIEILSKSNPQFLIWYMTYQIQFNPIMQLNKLQDEFHMGPVIIEGKDLFTAYQEGLMEIEQAISTKLAYNYQQIKKGEKENGCGRTDPEQD